MLKSLIIKTLAAIMFILGIALRRKTAIDLKTIKRVLINRCDRIGDAVISFPLLLELGRQFDLTVITSETNDFVLKNFFRTVIFRDVKFNIFQQISAVFKNTILLFFNKKRNPVFQYDLCIDLVGISRLDVFRRLRQKFPCRYYIGFNLGIANLFLDYAYPSSPALFSKSNLIDSYRRLLKESLGLDIDVPADFDLSLKLRESADFKSESPFIMINISGSKKFRGPSPRMFADIISYLNFKGKIVVLDEPGHPNTAEFKRHIKRGNLIYLPEEYSLAELLDISRRGLLYIGSDSGITHSLASATNCVIFFGAPSPFVWRPYSKYQYRLNKVGTFIVEELRNSRSQIKKIIYRPVWCRPCFDFGCRRYRCINDIDIPAVAAEIDNTVDSILGQYHKKI